MCVSSREYRPCHIRMDAIVTIVPALNMGGRIVSSDAMPLSLINGGEKFGPSWEANPGVIYS